MQLPDARRVDELHERGHHKHHGEHAHALEDADKHHVEDRRQERKDRAQVAHRVQQAPELRAAGHALRDLRRVQRLDVPSLGVAHICDRRVQHHPVVGDGRNLGPPCARAAAGREVPFSFSGVLV